MAYTRASIDNVMTTQLNSLADATASSAVEVVNGVDLHRFGDFELLAAAAVAPVAGAIVELVLLTSVDDANFATQTSRSVVATFGGWLANTSAQRHFAIMIPIPPADFQVIVVNQLGQAFAATGNTLNLRRYS